jgi:hypothetical protein
MLLWLDLPLLVLGLSVAQIVLSFGLGLILPPRVVALGLHYRLYIPYPGL